MSNAMRDFLDRDASPFPPEARRIDVTPKVKNPFEGLSATAEFRFTANEIAEILAEFVRARGLTVDRKDVHFNVHQASNDPREYSSPGLTDAVVKVKL